ncbi:MAG: RNA-binding protein [Deltaproteobacteria bacterium]|jgi:RNA recognition motif-containing protein|nr:RNA-binding protein [Deltaproteobacteria bacterium]
MKTIYVGNLPFSSTPNEISDLFGRYGTVHSVNVISDKETGRPRGFAFVEMDPDEAIKAIDALNGSELGGRSLRVNEARTREDRGHGGNRGGFRRNE